MQIAAMNPQFVRQDDIAQDVRDHENGVLIAKAKEDPKNAGKKDEILAKIIEGQLAKWAKEICLMDQAFVKDPDKTIEAIQQGLVAKIGENIRVRRFVRWELGEGLEKTKGDFAAEVAAAAGQA
jgi:elongation factor Ts